MVGKPRQRRLRGPRGAALLAVLPLLWSCQSVPRPPPTTAPAAPADFPADRYERDGGTVYRVDHDASRVTMFVYREGPLARLGHNHVVSTSAIGGLARLSGENPGADLYIAVDTLVVDDAALRAAAGADFESAPTQADIDGTRGNMLGPDVLHADTHPFVRVAATWATDALERGPDATIHASVDFSVRGAVYVTTVPLRVIAGADSVLVTGSTQLAQTAFGIEPFSVLGGALRVRDVVDISIDLVLVPAVPPLARNTR